MPENSSETTVSTRPERRSDGPVSFEPPCREMADALMQIVWTSGPDGVVDYYNQEWYDFSGLPPGTVGNACWEGIIHPDDYPGLVAAYGAALAAGTMLETEVRAIRPSDGKVHWFLVRARPFRDEFGRIVRWYGASTDITAHKETQQAYQATAERLHLALDAAGLGPWDWDIVRNEINWSPEHNAMFDIPADELRGSFERGMAHVHPEDRARAADSLREAVAQHRDSYAEVRSVHRDGSLHWILVQGRAVYDAAGQPVRMIGVTQDITRRKNAEAAMKAAVEEAERANNAKSKFLSRMSHELRTPLNAILGFGQVLGLNILSQQDRNCVEYILKSGRHLLELVGDVLDLARIDSGELRINRRVIFLDPIVRECVGLVAKMADAAEVTCEISTGPAGASNVWADEQRLRQILLNLFSNAIKYNRKGGRMTVTCKPFAKDRVRLAVQDTGAGITSEDLARLFVPFERLGQEFGEIEGTGLGLTVSRRLAEAMGGSLGAKSRVGVGSTFWIDLPASVSAVPPAGGKKKLFAAGQESGGAAEPTVGMTILYVEDNASNREVFTTILGRVRPHWRLLCAPNGPAGLELARSSRPAVIALDLELPGMHGDAFLAALHADDQMRDIPVLMLTADATAASRQRLLALGAKDYVTKPFDVHALVEKLDAFVPRAGSHPGGDIW